MNKKHITYYPLSELSDKIMVGIASAATHAYRESGIPMLRNLNVKEGFIDTSDILYLDQKYELQHKNKRLKSGDVITVRTGYPGQSAVVTSEFEGHQCFTCLVTRPKIDKLDSHYLCFYINSPVGKKFMGSAEAGGAQKNVNASVLARMPIPLISLLEQRKIVEILKEWDSAIAITEKLITAKRRLKQVLTQEILNAKLRFPATSREPWREQSLSKLISSLNAGISVNSENRQCRDKELGILKTSAVTYGIFNPKEHKAIIKIEENKASISPKKDRIIISRMNTPNLVGASVYVDQDYPDLFLPDRLWQAEPKDIQNSMLWLSYVLNSKRLRRIISSTATGTSGSMKNITKESFLSIKISVPPVEEQKKIAEVLSIVDLEIAKYVSMLKLFQTQKQGLMQQLLTGKIRVQTP